MFLKMSLAIVLIMAAYYGAYRFGGDYRYLSEGDHISAYPGETLFNVPVVSGRFEGDWLEIERPDTGVRTVVFAGKTRDRIMSAKNCGRLRVELDANRQAHFHKSGCFLDF